MSMTSAQIRQGFLDFFREKRHTLVPSSSLLPDAPNLLFTNSGMNQFVPIFLGERSADVSRWAGAVPGSDTRAADTQKCIRAGGKHNDLEDVGLDTYHHTFFEMLGNWSFGDYFKREAIAWAWELVVERWKFPADRLYATIYQPDQSQGDPAERDEEAWEFWAEKFRSVGLDPAVHIVNGNKKDNFWMMGETGPCGPCSELHVDLTPAGDTKGALVNAGSDKCIEIWNLVFIQFNAEPDGPEEAAKMMQPGAKVGEDWRQRFVPLPAKHVDTGMGLERVVSIIQGTKDFSDFANAKISNYETDVFRPLFDELEKMSGKKYGSTLPAPNAGGAVIPTTEDEKRDVAFRVIADHIRTLSFAVADGIQPSNDSRGYVLRRILRRAVRYGRTLGFREPFFYKLTAVLSRTMGDVFPEIRAKQSHIEETLRREEEQFNRTLDKGIALFEAEVGKLTGDAPSPVTGVQTVGGKGSVGVPPAPAGVPPGGASEGAAFYRKRRLPHYEQPHGIYHVAFSTRERRVLSPAARTEVINALRHFDGQRYDLLAACVMPDHVHVLMKPTVKSRAEDGTATFWPLDELMHSIKSFTAKRINALEGTEGHVWEAEYHDRLMRSDSDIEEKFLYIVHNPWAEGAAGPEEDYPWLWTPSSEAQPLPSARRDAGRGGRDAHAPRSSDDLDAEKTDEDASRAESATVGASSEAGRVLSGAFAFRLYDEQGFPLDLTELMARERGLAVDTAGFDALMDQQRARARASQKKEVIELSQIDTKSPTHFIGYDHGHTGANVLEVAALKDRTLVVLDNSVCYAEMGGQVGDTGELDATQGAKSWRVANTQKSGDTWLHFLEAGEDAPAVGDHVSVRFDRARRRAIERHHSVTHILHWALHEMVSREAVQKGSFVGPDKLTFDFSSAALTPAQLRDVERLVNERLIENEPVSWTDVPYAEVRGRADIMQFFGDKYGDRVRVVQIGGEPCKLDGWSMELCAGTHVRRAGEIGLFRIVSEGATGSGVRRIEAVAGAHAAHAAQADAERLRGLATLAGVPLGDLEKRIEAMLAHQKELEKSLRAAAQREAAARAKEMLGSAETVGAHRAIIANLGALDGDALQAASDAILKVHNFEGVVVLGGSAGGAVSLVAGVAPALTKQVQAGKIIQAIAPIVGGKGGGRPDSARGGGRDASKLDEALAKAKTLL